MTYFNSYSVEYDRFMRLFVTYIGHTSIKGLKSLSLAWEYSPVYDVYEFIYLS